MGGLTEDEQARIDAIVQHSLDKQEKVKATKEPAKPVKGAGKGKLKIKPKKGAPYPDAADVERVIGNLMPPFMANRRTK